MAVASLERIPGEAIAATDLRRAYEGRDAVDGVGLAYRVRFEDCAEIGWLLYFPRAGRAGIAAGGAAAWTDCRSEEDAINRWQDGNMDN